MCYSLRENCSSSEKGVTKLVQTLRFFLSLWELGVSFGLQGQFTGVPPSLPSCSIIQALHHLSRNLNYTDHPPSCFSKKTYFLGRKKRQTSVSLHFLQAKKYAKDLIQAFKALQSWRENWWLLSTSKTY